MVFDDFPFWLRFAHFINIIFITLLIRSGIEILSALPKCILMIMQNLEVSGSNLQKRRCQKIGSGSH